MSNTQLQSDEELAGRIVQFLSESLALVFVNTTEDIAAVEAKMNHLGISTQALYGDADKMARSGVLDRFRKGKFKVLVASDLAARGLDIEGLTMVINYDPPVDSEHYVHRAGRTGRMGRTGIVLSIITDRQAFIIKKFTKELQTPIGLRLMSSGKVIKPGEEISRTRNVSQNTNDKLIANVQNPSLNKPVKAEIVERPQPRVSSESITSVGQSPETPRKPARNPGASKSERERVRKNKGAPKWLKNKPPRI